MRGRHGKHWWQLALATVGIPLLVYAFSSGPPPGVTGGFGEPTCSQSGCHVGIAVNSGPGSVTITVRDPDSGEVVSTYASGKTYQVTVLVADPNQRRWGFELSARRQDTGQQAGTLIRGTDNFTNFPVTFGGVQYITHSTTGTRPGTPLGADFVFGWTSPDVSAGPVIFHAAGNAANGNFDPSGDRIYTFRRPDGQQGLILEPEVSGPVPTVAEGGTVNAASSTTPVAPGSIVAISGSNLTLDGAQAFGMITGGDLSTSLAGTSATMNGFAMPLLGAFPNKLYAQVPFEVAGSPSASLQVEVAGRSSAPREVFLDTVSPGIFFMPTPHSVAQGAILNASDGTIAAPTGSLAGVPARPAKPGQDTLVIFCNGLGEVFPPLATGEAATTNTTTQPVTVLINGSPATPEFAGMARMLVGLNEVRVPLPADTPAGDAVPVVITMPNAGKSSNTVTIAVAP